MMKPNKYNTLDNLLEGCQLIGFDWRYLYVNEAVVKQSKYKTKDDLIGYTMMEKYPGIENTELFSVLTTCMKDRTFDTMINEFTFPDNSKEWYELRIEPVPEGLFILSLNITEQKKVEQTRKEYIDTLEEMMVIISHKVRLPVCNILGVLDMIDNSQMTIENMNDIANYVRDDIKALDSFTKELTAFMQEKKIKQTMPSQD